MRSIHQRLVISCIVWRAPYLIVAADYQFVCSRRIQRRRGRKVNEVGRRACHSIDVARVPFWNESAALCPRGVKQGAYSEERSLDQSDGQTRNGRDLSVRERRRGVYGKGRAKETVVLECCPSFGRAKRLPSAGGCAQVIQSSYICKSHCPFT